MKGRFNRGFLRYRFGGLIFGGAYTCRGLFLEFYGISFLIKYTKAILHWPQSNRICLQVRESVLFILFTLYGEHLVSGLKASKAIALWISLVIVPSTFAGGKCFLAYLSHPTENNVLTPTDIQCTMQHTWHLSAKERLPACNRYLTI